MFPDGCDYIADCIDLVSCKVDLIVTAKERGEAIVSALGTGNKLDAQQLRITDLALTSGCPFARVLRRELKKRGVPASKPMMEGPHLCSVRSAVSCLRAFIPWGTAVTLN